MTMNRGAGILACVLLASLAGCRGGVGAPCDGTNDCQDGLRCATDRTCQPAGTDASSGTDASGETDTGTGTDANSGTDAAGGSDAAPGTDAANGTDAAPGSDAAGPPTDAGGCTASVDSTDPYWARFEGDSYENGCIGDADCFVGGCSGEVCAAEPAITTCEALPYLPGGMCMCLAGACTWAVCGP